MTALPANRLLSQAANDLAADSRALDALKRDAQRDPQGAMKKAAQQFEALFMQMVLKSMREATPKTGLLDSSSQDMYTGMLDQQLAAKIAAGGTGLADVIAKQLARHMQPTPPADAGRPGADGVVPAAPQRATAIDRYAELARPNPRAVSRYDEMARTAGADAARAAYLERRNAPMPAPESAADPRADRPGVAAVGSAAGTALGTSPQRAFITRHWDSALAAERATGIPARFVLGQAALESGWGRAEIRGADGLPSHNLFGIKAGGTWRGRTVEVVTTEYEGGVPQRVVERFRAYNNYSEAFRDWAQLLAGSPRYAGVLAQGRDAAGFAYGLQRAGYATDPAYGAKLSRVISDLSALGERV